MKISYVTGNPAKLENAQTFFKDYNVEVDQLPLHIEEIQSGDSLEIARAKAQSAFAIHRQPLFVNDATWIIPVLNGFPGPFMKYINQWFQPLDFVHLMQGKSDRRIILRDSIVFIDESGQKVFTNDHEGEILETVAPFDYRHPTDVVISLSKDRKSIAEARANGQFFIENEDLVWKEFANWLLAR